MADVADDIVVMYAGKSMEIAPKDTIFNSPCHPYTHGLIRSIPQLDTKAERLYSIQGTVPDIRNFPPGLPFLYAVSLCSSRMQREGAAVCKAK